LFVLGGINKNVYLSARNLERSSVVTNSEISTYSIMNAQHLVFLESSLEQIESNLS
jgi:large subunit ribosomal protein L4